MASSVSDPTSWVELPTLLPKHMVQARKIRYVFTGDLEAVVHTSPAYPGREKHLVGYR